MKLSTFFNSVDSTKVAFNKIPRVIFIFESHDCTASSLTIQDNLTFLKQKGMKGFGPECYVNSTPQKFCAIFTDIIKPNLKFFMNPSGYLDSKGIQLAERIEICRQYVPWYQPRRGHEEALSLKFETFGKILADKDFSFFSYDVNRTGAINVEISMAQGINKALNIYNDIIVNVGAAHASKILEELKKLRPELHCINFFFLTSRYDFVMPDDAYVIIDDGRLTQSDINELFQRVITNEINKKNEDSKLAATYRKIIELSPDTIIIEIDKVLVNLKNRIVSEIQYLLAPSVLWKINTILKTKLQNFLLALESVDYMPLRYAMTESNIELSKNEIIMIADLKNTLHNANGVEFTNLKNLLADFQGKINIFALELFEDKIDINAPRTAAFAAR